MSNWFTIDKNWDHMGGHAFFEDISIHKEDAGWLRNGLPLPEHICLLEEEKGYLPLAIEAIC
ncbi:MAG: hypothetical protein WCD89_03230 [Anaerocolumna sp.]